MPDVTITINGESVRAQAGRRLVEVIKEQGVAITNLCYIDGLEPYAGCRTCLVEVQDGRPPIQTSCTAQVADGMVIHTNTPAVKLARQGVMSLIMANHPDRCLTCHRRVHCQPGEICLRDDVVTHRCLTCSKNYRCELQTSTEMVDMGEFEEPWVGEERSYYETPAPEPDRANPYLEFDPQMCIICTRCVRACADIRHTGAISLSGKGSTTMIAFGAGGAVHESDCNFCGSCIDVCPTATLMEKPNKWTALTETWTNSTCNGCSVGCTISYGVSGGRPVIVRPDRLNAFSRDQICVRGRFGYDAVQPNERLGRALTRHGDRLLPVPLDEAIADAATRLGAVRDQHGADAIAFLGSPLTTNEEAFALAGLAAALGTPHIDFSHGATHRAVQAAIRTGLGLDRLPSTLTDIEHAQTIVVVAGDLEQSHQVAALRIKDAVVKHGAQLVVISPRWSELVPFATAWLRPTPGTEAQAVQALAAAIDGSLGAAQATSGVDADAFVRAAAACTAGATANGGFAVVYAPTATDAGTADQARAAVNLAIAARRETAANAFHYLPTDANVHGIADMGVAPGANGRGFAEIIAGARSGAIHALVVHADNPLLNAPGTADIIAALDALDALIVIDGVRSTLAERADVVLPDLPFFAKHGTLTTADRHVVRQQPAQAPHRDEQDAVATLAALGRALGAALPCATAAEAAVALASAVPGYVPLAQVRSGRSRALDANATSITAYQPVAALPTTTGDGLLLITGRPLYTSWEGASIRSAEADKLHREETVLLHPHDAEAAHVRNGEDVALAANGAELRIRVQLDDGIAPGTAYVPAYYDGGAVMALLPLGGGPGAGARVRVRALQTA